MVSKKRNRLPKSCGHCRDKKLKCNRERPRCDTCIKHNLDCGYTGPPVSDDDENDEVAHLKKLLKTLEKRREKLIGNQGEDIGWNFTQGLSSVFFFKKSKYISAIFKLIKPTADLPDYFKDEVENHDNRMTRLDVLKESLMEGADKLNKIQSFFTNITLVYEYVNHFFESQLFMNCSFVNRTEVLEFLNEHATKQGLVFDGKVTGRQYCTIGIVLLILRISYISFFDIRRPDKVIPFVVGPDAYYLAVMCLEEMMFPGDQVNEQVIALMVLLKYHQRFSNESLGLTELEFKTSLLDVDREVMRFNLINETGGENAASNFKRRLWHTIVYMGYQLMIYNGMVQVYSRDMYTTKLPLLLKDPEKYQMLINSCFRDRAHVIELVEPLANLLTDARNPPTINIYQLYLDAILLRVADEESLDEILAMPSKTKADRTIKMSKFVKLLDLDCILLVMAVNILMIADESYKGESFDSKWHIKPLLNIIKVLNPCLQTFNFLNPRKAEYDIKNHFGSSIELIPLILKVSSKVMIFLIMLISKARHQLTIRPSEKLKELNKALTENFKAIASYMSGISHCNLHAKCLAYDYRYIGEIIYGKNCDRLTDPYKELLGDPANSLMFNDEICTFIMDKLITLDPLFDFPATKEPFRGHINQLLDSQPAVTEKKMDDLLESLFDDECF